MRALDLFTNALGTGTHFTIAHLSKIPVSTMKLKKLSYILKEENHVRTCDQIITPPKNASVCSISFSALRPTKVTKSPDLCDY